MLRSRELDVQAYKIFQDRTLCEMVRRRRNDPSWGYYDAIQSDEECGDCADKKTATPLSTIQEQLRQCWGVGPSKVKDEDGFAFEAISIMNKSQQIKDLLETSLLSKGE